MHIAQILSAITTLRTVRLNLDFHDTCGVLYQDQHYDLTPLWDWCAAVETRGAELFHLFRETCTSLEYVALIAHGFGSWWREWHPAPMSTAIAEDVEVRQEVL